MNILVKKLEYLKILLSLKIFIANGMERLPIFSFLYFTCCNKCINNYLKYYRRFYKTLNKTRD